MAHLYLRGTGLAVEAGARPARIEAVLFDKDGTLSHSEPMLLSLARARIEACSRLLERRRGPSFTQVPEFRQLLARAYGIAAEGLDPAGLIAVAARDHNLLSTATVLAQFGLGWPEALDLAEQAFLHTDHLHDGREQSPAAPTDGLESLLRNLASEGVRCAVISNDQETGIRAFLERHGLAPHFSGIWSADHHPRKPDPAAVHALCTELAVAPHHCALIGDADSDLRMGAAAGVGLVLGYGAGWSRSVQLDPRFPHLGHWCELEARGAVSEN